MKEKTKDFIKKALIRAGRTFAQTAVGVIGSAALIQSVDWLTVLSAATLAAVVSLLMSWATGLPEADGRKESQPWQR